jgi:hypothetical protein
LTSAGFADVRLRGLNEPMYFGADPDDAFRFVSEQITDMPDGLDDTGRAHALDTLRASIAVHHTDRGVLYGSAAWLIEAHRP